MGSHPAPRIVPASPPGDRPEWILEQLRKRVRALSCAVEFSGEAGSWEGWYFHGGGIEESTEVYASEFDALVACLQAVVEFALELLPEPAPPLPPILSPCSCQTDVNP